MRRYEIDHALGLAHPEDYNAEGDTDVKRIGESGLCMNPQTPAPHDLLAIQALYGAESTTRKGYNADGFNASVDRAVFDFQQNPSPVLTILGAGGRRHPRRLRLRG